MAIVLLKENSCVSEGMFVTGKNNGLLSLVPVAINALTGDQNYPELEKLLVKYVDEARNDCFLPLIKCLHAVL